MPFDFDPFPMQTRRAEERRAAQRQRELDELAALQNTVPTPRIQAPQEPVDDRGVFEKYGPTAVRGLGALLGLTPLRGVGASAVAELAAEGLEIGSGSREKLSLPELAAAGVTGGLGGKLATEVGKNIGLEPLKAALRAAPWAAAQPIAHSVIANQELPDANEVLTSTMIGAGTAGGASALARWLLGGKAAQAAAPAAKTFEVETTARPGGTVFTGVPGKKGTPKTASVTQPPPIKAEGELGLGPEPKPRVSSDVPYNYSEIPPEFQGGVINPKTGQPFIDETAVSASSRMQKNISAENEAAAKAAAVAEKEAANAARLEEIEAAKANMQPIPPTIRETVSAETPGGGKSALSRMFRVAEEEGDEAAEAAVSTASPMAQQTNNVLAEGERLLGGQPAAQAAPAAAAPAAKAAGAAGGDLEKAMAQIKGAPTAALTQLLKEAQDPALKKLIRAELGARQTRALAEGKDISAAAPLPTPPPAPVEAAPAAQAERRLGIRAGEEFRGNPLATMMQAVAEKQANPTILTAEQMGIGGTKAAPEARDAIVAAERAALPEPLTPQELAQKAEEMRTGFAERAGKNMEVPRGGVADEAESVIHERRSGERMGEQFREPQEPYTGPTAAQAQAAPGAAPAVAEGVSPATLYKSRLDASGQHYRALKDLLAGQGLPEMPGTGFANPARLAGTAMQTEARAAGLPTRASNFAKAEGPAANVERQAAADIKAMLSKPTQGPSKLPGRAPIGGSGLPPGRMRSGFTPEAGMSPEQRLAQFTGDESGQIIADPALIRAGMAASGAIIGGALDPMEDRTLSAIVGGAAGAMVPNIVSKVAQLAPLAAQAPNLSSAGQAFLNRIGNKEGFAQELKSVWAELPHYIRFNLLSSVNLPTNAFAAPYGSGIMFALERHLAGDPRGTKALELIGSPANWGAKYADSWDEAVMRIGQSERAGGEMIGQAPTATRKFLAAPGTMMTAGDITTRRLLQTAGFSETEARMATLTSEPETAFFKSISNLGRSQSPLMQMMLPFSKTVSNIGEQGAMRIPILGEFVQAAREQADPATTRLLQQALGLGVGTAAGGVGYLAGEDGGPTGLGERMTRSLISNAAGAYSLPATIGFAVGDALGRGKENPAWQGVKSGFNELPLPAVDLPLGYASALNDLLHGDVNVPSGTVPSVLRTAYQESNKGGRKAHREPRQPRKNPKSE